LAPAAQAANALAAPSVPAYNAEVIGAWLSDTYKLGAPPSALGQTAPSAPLGIGPTSSNTQAPNVDPINTASAQTGSAPVSGWIVQIGAGPSEDGARAMLSDAARKVGTLGDFR